MGDQAGHRGRGHEVVDAQAAAASGVAAGAVVPPGVEAALGMVGGEDVDQIEGDDVL